MKRIILATLIVAIAHLASGQEQPSADHVVKIEMNLSAFGVESDDFPSIDVVIYFSNDSSRCVKSFYNPAYEGSVYSLTKGDIRSVRQLLRISDLERLRNEYSVSKSDQPRATTKIYTTKRVFVIDDYGMEGEYPLKELYRIVYKF